MLTRAAESGWQGLQWTTRPLRSRLTIEVQMRPSLIESPHLPQVSSAETSSKTLCQVSGKLLNQLLSIFGPCLTLLFKFHDAPSDFPIGRCHEGVDAARRRSSCCLEKRDDLFVYMAVVPLNHVPSRVCHLQTSRSCVA